MPYNQTKLLGNLLKCKDENSSDPFPGSCSDYNDRIKHFVLPCIYCSCDPVSHPGQLSCITSIIFIATTDNCYQHDGELASE